MAKFYTNRELAQSFSINLAKWKRWSREFLPPDPLGGLQSGYARQYNLDEAFTIFLGGHLVGDLKFTIPETRNILQDLHQWLVDHGFFFDYAGDAISGNQTNLSVENYQIAIISGHFTDTADFKPLYRIKSTITSDSIDFMGIQMRRERFIESSINARGKLSERYGTESYRVLNISGLRKTFLDFFEINADTQS